MKYGWTFFVVTLFITSCNNNRSIVTNHYYPVDSLLNAQAIQLTQLKAILTKKATIGTKSETQTYTPVFDTAATAWKHELDVFFELHDINKPSNRNKYTLARAEQDSNSNLLVYSLTANETLPVVYYKVFYLNTIDNIRKVEALYREESTLLKSSRKLSLEFQQIHNKIVLTSYSVTGGQKMLLADSVTFSVNGTITYP